MRSTATESKIDLQATTPSGIMGSQDDTKPYARHALPRDELLRRLTAQFQTFDGCERVSVVGVTQLDEPDSAGCNWSSSIVLDPLGVQPEVYGLAYCAVIAEARFIWNLKH